MSLVADYVTRSVDLLLPRLLRELPALFLVGPRATGKTTTAIRHVASVLRLDEPGLARAVEADPDAALRGLDEPVLIDEWQMVPSVLGAVKRSLDKDAHPGRFLLTGSVRAELDDQTWPGTGRVVRVPMYGLSAAELLRGPTTTTIFDQLAADEPPAAPAAPPDLRDYVELALRSGFPEAVDLSEDARERWLDSYVDQLTSRDAQQQGARHNPVTLRRYFEAYAANTAGIVDHKLLYDSAGITRQTASDYENALISLRVVEKTPAWTSNRLKRLVRSPKRYVIEPALMATALNLNTDGYMRNGEMLGRLLDTFVMAQLRAERALGRVRPSLLHVRDAQGRREVDLIAEMRGQQIVGIEIKAKAGPGPSAAKHLAWLRAELGDQFLAGIVFHTGKWAYPLGERITAVPIASLWV